MAYKFQLETIVDYDISFVSRPTDFLFVLGVIGCFMICRLIRETLF